jgi:hypothetical protein
MSEDLQTLVAKADLLHVGIIHAQFYRGPEFDPRGKSAKKFMSDRLEGDVVYDPEEKVLSAQILCRVWANPQKVGETITQDEAFDSAELMIEATYLIAFEVEEGEAISNETCRRFIDTIGRMSVWPYFRAHCARVASESNVALPPLPLKKARHAIRQVDYVLPSQGEKKKRKRGSSKSN